MVGERDGDRNEALAQALAAARAKLPDAQMAEAYCVGLNGVVRGKRVPIGVVEQLAVQGPGALRFQSSLAGLDIFGSDVPASGIAMEIGDPDGLFVPLAHTLAPVPGSHEPMLAVQGMLADAEGSLSAFDPRAALLRVLDCAAAQGLTPVVALELEFYLIDPAAPRPANHPLTGAPLDRQQMMDLDVLAAFDPVLCDIETGGKVLGIATQTVLAEFGAGQFEINLRHHADAARACDELIALKRLIRAAARRHGLDATFMAKPFDAWSGSGLHLHLSLQDEAGRNVFDEPGEPVGPRIGAAVAGLAATARDAFLLYSPHLNSYRRHRAGAYAPVSASWGLDNRSAAIRLPAWQGPAARVEHRIAGADANPYLVSAAVIAGVLHGLRERLEPGPISRTDEAHGPAFPRSWPEAIDLFAASEFGAEACGGTLRHVFASMKRQEEALLRRRVSDVEHALYLRTV